MAKKKEAEISPAEAGKAFVEVTKDLRARVIAIFPDATPLEILRVFDKAKAALEEDEEIDIVKELEQCQTYVDDIFGASAVTMKVVLKAHGCLFEDDDEDEDNE